MVFFIPAKTVGKKCLYLPKDEPVDYTVLGNRIIL